MTGKREYISYYVECISRSITFGDAVKNKVVGFGALNVKGLAQLTNVLHVEGDEGQFDKYQTIV